MPTSLCPDRKDLLEYVVGRLSDPASDALAEHLDACQRCQAELLTLPEGDDTLVGRLRQPAAPDPYVEEAACHAALSRAKKEEREKGRRGEEEARRGDDGLRFSASPLLPSSFSPPLQLPYDLGEYQLLEELGHGSMGTVYKARHTKLDRTVAIKILARGRMDDPRAIARFEREMKAIGRLEHPNIVRAHDAREIDGRPVLVMEYVEGLDLGKLARRLGPISVAAACELARQAALALQYAHEHGLVHRDVKPSNLMLAGLPSPVLGRGVAGEGISVPSPISGRGAGGEGISVPSPVLGRGAGGEGPQPHVKLLDLGLARVRWESGAGDEMTGSGQAMGTADYMAPEQVSDSHDVDIRADVYSLGCTLYRLLCGQAPFSGPEYRGSFEKMAAHVHQPVPPIRQLRPEVPEELAAVMDRMLAKDPADRFATPGEVAVALEPFCAGNDLKSLLTESPRHPVTLSPRRPSPAPARRRPTIKTLLIALGFLAAMAASFAAGVLITINRNGEKYQVEVPKDSHTVIDDRGNVAVNILGKAQGGKASAADPTAEFEALQGWWKVVRVEKGRAADVSSSGILSNPLGVGFPVAAGSDNLETVARLRFEEEVVLVQDKRVDRRWGFTYRIDPAAAPRTIDLLVDPTSNPLSIPLHAVGIYEIEGDRLKICLVKYLPSQKSDRRPKSFAIEPESGAVLLVLERYRPSEDARAIEGEHWAVATRVEDGRSVSEADHGGSQPWWYDPDSMVFYTSDVTGQWYYMLDDAKQQKTVVISRMDFRDAKLNREEYSGIYNLDGAGGLHIAYRKGSSPPEKFESLPGSGVTLLVLRNAPFAGVGGGVGGAGVSPVPSNTGKMPVPPSAQGTVVKPPAVIADRLVPLEKAIQGTWQVVSSTQHLYPLNYGGSAGIIKAEDVVKTTRVVITADTMKFFGQHVRSTVYQYRVNTESSPPAIDIECSYCPTIGRVRLGILRLEGDNLRLCFGSPESYKPVGRDASERVPPERPTEFWAEMGTWKELLVLKRVGDVLIDPEEKSLQGTWRVESNSMEAMFERSKVKTEIENMKTRAGPTLAWGGILALVLSKDQTVQITGQCILSLAESEGVAGPRATDDIAYYATNPQSQPKAIDLFEPHAWTVSANAIYRLDGERLTLCLMKADGVRRPASFDVPPDQNTARIVLRRVPDVGKTPAGKTVAGAGPAQTPPRPSLAEIEQVRHQIDAFNKALAQRRLEWGDYPSNDEGLKALLQRAQTRDGRLLGGTWIEAVPPDPWGHAYQYQYPSSHGKGTPDIWSNGPDGKPIGSWEQ